MADFNKAKVTAPVLHASLFFIASALMWASNRPLLQGPASFPFLILWIADIPISLIAFNEMFFSDKYGWTAWALWGGLGTLWWYFLGLSIDAWIRRLSRHRDAKNLL